MKNSQFSRSSVILIICALVILFALSVIFGAAPIEKNSADGGRAQADSYSVSAIGHAAFYEAAQSLDYYVERNIGKVSQAVGDNDTLLLLEPSYGSSLASHEIDPQRFKRVMLVLPKWAGLKDSNKPKWLRSAVQKPIATPISIIKSIDNNANVVRVKLPLLWAKNKFGITPSFELESQSVQLISSKRIKPVVAAANGDILVGEIINDGKRLLIVSDPDLLSNHGFFKGNNAALALSLLENLCQWENNDDYDDYSSIVFDEAIHGYHREKNTSVLTILFRFPFIIVTLLSIVLIALIAAAGSSRFGAAKIPEPALDYGKAQLIENSSKLFDSAGHHVLVLKRYIWMSLRIAALSLHAPRGLDERSLINWLDRAVKNRKISRPLSEIMNPVILNTADHDKTSVGPLFECARGIYIWKGEVLNATAKYSHDN